MPSDQIKTRRYIIERQIQVGKHLMKDTSGTEHCRKNKKQRNNTNKKHMAMRSGIN